MTEKTNIGYIDLHISRTTPGTGNTIPQSYNDPLPSDSSLEIWSNIDMIPAYWELIKFTDLALETNFMTADFAGDLTMDYPELTIHDDFMYFKFTAGILPTSWDLEVILTIEIMDRGCGSLIQPSYWFTLPGAVKDDLGFTQNAFQLYELPIEL